MRNRPSQSAKLQPEQRLPPPRGRVGLGLTREGGWGKISHNNQFKCEKSANLNSVTVAIVMQTISRRTVLGILKMILTGARLNEVLMNIARLIEARGEGMLCSIFLLDKGGVQLRYGTSLSLPESYRAATDGLTIGLNVGSCGTGIFRRKPVFVADILSDPGVGYPVVDQAGEVIELVGTSLDVTEQQGTRMEVVHGENAVHPQPRQPFNWLLRIPTATAPQTMTPL